ncbi:MAG: TM2 domain-containing protein [Muribaculaceae bacterium]|nr:TM2 domain-containing protein [Muribaculaceae bacterium]MBR5117012.1 TM2 domain-containing protein [Muribaculaceae bacterium]
MTNKDNFPVDKMPVIQQALGHMDENTFNNLSMLQFKSPMTALLLSIFCGSLGVDRFYLGDTGLGIGKLLTAGGCGIWAIIDWFKIQDATREKNFEQISKYL